MRLQFELQQPLISALKRNAPATSYLPVAGALPLEEALA
jgi:hypothetical protein